MWENVGWTLSPLYLPVVYRSRSSLYFPPSSSCAMQQAPCQLSTPLLTSSPCHQSRVFSHIERQKGRGGKNKIEPAIVALGMCGEWVDKKGGNTISLGALVVATSLCRSRIGGGGFRNQRLERNCTYCISPLNVSIMLNVRLTAALPFTRTAQ